VGKLAKIRQHFEGITLEVGEDGDGAAGEKFELVRKSSTRGPAIVVSTDRISDRNLDRISPRSEDSGGGLTWPTFRKQNGMVSQC
jgi:hypothetical protein